MSARFSAFQSSCFFYTLSSVRLSIRGSVFVFLYWCNVDSIACVGCANFVRICVCIRSASYLHANFDLSVHALFAR